MGKIKMNIIHPSKRVRHTRLYPIAKRDVPVLDMGLSPEIKITQKPISDPSSHLASGK